MSAGDLAQRGVAAINARDLQTLLEISTDDIEIIPLRAAVEDTTYRGAEGIAQWLRDIDEVWTELRIELDETEEPAPGIALSVGRIQARGHASDALTSMPIAMVGWERDGLIAKSAVFPDRAAAERAIAESL